MNLPGAAFWWPTTGCWLAVGRTAMATAAASDANPMTAKAMTALPSTRDRLLNGTRPVAPSSASPNSPNSSYSGPNSSAPSGSPSSAIEYANCGSWTAAPAAGAKAVWSPVSPAAGAIAVASPAGAPASGMAASAAPRASAKVGSSGISTRMVDASRSWSATPARFDDAPTR